MTEEREPGCSYHTQSPQAEPNETGLFSERFGDRYASGDDPLAESEHVFVRGNRLPQRWRTGPAAQAFTVGEIGFGTGLNLLTTSAAFARRPAGSGPAYLHYVGFERYPLSVDQLQGALARHFEPSPIQQHLCRLFARLSGGSHRLWIAPDILLDLHIGDAEDMLHRLDCARGFDAWYLDGFQPALNPELWTPSLMRQIARLSAPGGTLSSYSAVGVMRRDLQAAGFAVRREPGFGSKRHMTVAELTIEPEAAKPQTAPKRASWCVSEGLPQQPGPGQQHPALIVGAGLSGCATALALARRGIDVMVLDQADSPATLASGIPALAVRPRLYRQAGADALFYLNAFQAARSQLHALAATESVKIWQELPLLQTQSAQGKRKANNADSYRRLYPDTILTTADADSLSRLSGVTLGESGFNIHGGRLDGQGFCLHALAHPKIRFVGDSKALSLQQAGAGWQIQTAQGEILETELLVLANAAAASLFEQTRQLPVDEVLGQSTTVKANPLSANLKTVVSGPKTLFPAGKDGMQHITASYQRDRQSLSAAEIAANNKQNIQGSFAHFGLGEPAAIITQRIAPRASSLDHLPLIGAMPDREQMRKRYIEASRSSHDQTELSASYFPGLYINTGHGSYGGVSCLYAGEILASLILGEAEPGGCECIDAVNPARFAIRELRRQSLTVEEGD